MKGALICALLLGGCHKPPPSPTPVRIEVPWPVKPPAKKLPHHGPGSTPIGDTPEAIVTASDPDDRDFGSPREVLKDGATVKDDARNYVLAPRSQPEVIDKLTELSRTYDAARIRMDENYAVRGYYTQADVRALQRALEALREALRAKGEGQ